MGQMKIRASSRIIGAEYNSDRDGVDLHLDPMLPAEKMTRAETKMLAQVLLGEIEEPIPGTTASQGAQMIATERMLQITRRGYSPAADADLHDKGELLAAASAYVDAAGRMQAGLEVSAEACGWPWDPETFQPRGYVENLVRAAALLAAEIDRVNR